MPKHPGIDKPVFDLSVVGLGPGGLTAILYAAAKGLSVIGFGNQSEYVRGQRVILTPESVRFLKKYLNMSDSLDREFRAHIRTSISVIQIKDLERFLYRKISQYPNAKLVIIDKNHPVELICEHKKHGIIIKNTDDEQTYSFQHLLAADGAKHHTANEVARVFNKKITYAKSPYQARHLYHAAVQLKLKDGISPPIAPTSQMMAQQQIKLGLQWMVHGWDMKKMNDMPKCYVLPNSNYTKFSFAGEIPPHIYNETNREIQTEQLKKWAALQINKEFGIPEEHLEFKLSKKHPQHHEKLKATTFEMTISVCKEPLIFLHEDESEGVFAQIGDARRTPYYVLGHGTNNAIESAITFVNCIDDTDLSFDANAYTSFIQKIDMQLDRSMQDEIEEKEKNITSARCQIDESIIELLPLLNALNIDTQAFQSVKEGGFSLPNLISVMSHVEDEINQLKESIKNEENREWTVLSEKIYQVNNSISYYSSSISDTIKYAEDSFAEENTNVGSKSFN